MKCPFNISNDLNNSSQNNQLLIFLMNRLEKFYNENKELIDDYQYMKLKLDELSYRKNLQYRFTISNSKSSGKVINAKLKYPFVKKENSKSKYPFFNIHVGKLSDYKKGLDDPQLKIDAKFKIEKYIDNKFPFTIQIDDNQVVKFTY